MPDIAMCDGGIWPRQCPSRFQCYRFMAVPDKYRQTYAAFNDNRDGDKCTEFMELWNRAGRAALEEDG